MGSNRHNGLLGTPLIAAAFLWLCPPPDAAASLQNAAMEPVVRPLAPVVRHRLTNSSTGAQRALVRAVRDLAVDRFDVDALPPRTPVEVWTVDGAVVAFAVARSDDDGGAFVALQTELDGEVVWVDGGGGTLQSPLSSRPVGYRAITSNIGLREHPLRKRTKFHAGTDFGAPIGTPVVAIADGVVVRTTRNWTAGRFIVVKHDTGYETRYLHLDRKRKGIEAGVRVQKGELLGLVGKSGRVTGPHLHFELRDRWGTPLDAGRIRWPAAGALTDARRLRELAQRVTVLQGVDTGRALELVDPARAPAAALRTHHANAMHGVSPVLLAPPGRADTARARMTPPQARRRRALPPGAALFDDVDESQLDDPLVRRALLLAAEFA